MARRPWILIALVLLAVYPVAAQNTPVNSKLVSISVMGAPVTDVIRDLFSQVGFVDYRIDPKVTGTISMYFKDEKFADAIRRVLRASNLTIKKDQGVYIIQPKPIDTPTGTMIRVGLTSNIGKPSSLTVMCTESFDIIDHSVDAPVDHTILPIVIAANTPITLNLSEGSIVIAKNKPPASDGDQNNEVGTFAGIVGLIPHVEKAVFEFSSPKARNNRYTGILEIRANTGLTVIDELSLEDYVRGVVPIEVPKSFRKEAQKALCVAIRTYAVKSLGSKRHDGFNICDCTHCQGFSGVSRAADWVNEVVDSTAGQILTYKGEPICAAYSTDCGGMTESNECAGFGKDPLPYLRSVADNPGGQDALKLQTIQVKEQPTPEPAPTHDYTRKEDYPDPDSSTGPPIPGGRVVDPTPPSEESRNSKSEIRNPDETQSRMVFPETDKPDFCDGCPVHSWTKRVKPSFFEKALKIGSLQSLDFTEYDSSGRVKTIVAKGDSGEKRMTGTQFRSLFGEDVIKSSRMVISVAANGDYVIEGRGYGHGVGLCAFGANGLAKQGKKYDEILLHYYPGTELTPGSGLH